MLATMDDRLIDDLQVFIQSGFAALVASWSLVLPLNSATAFKRFQKTAKCA